MRSLIRTWLRQTTIFFAVIIYMLTSALIAFGQTDDVNKAKIVIIRKPGDLTARDPNTDTVGRIILPNPKPSPAVQPPIVRNEPADTYRRVPGTSPQIVQPQRFEPTLAVRPKRFVKPSAGNATDLTTQKILSDEFSNDFRFGLNPLPLNRSTPSLLDRLTDETRIKSSLRRAQMQPQLRPIQDSIPSKPLEAVQVRRQSKPAQSQQAIFYRSDDRQPKVSMTNLTAPIQNQDELVGRDDFDILQPRMPQPVVVPGNHQVPGAYQVPGTYQVIPKQFHSILPEFQGLEIYELPELDPKRRMMLSKDEYLKDGGDRKLRATVDGDWNVKGLDTEDTIGHFDTVDGDRIVVPSNRVAIYAPRFSAVRKVGGFISADSTDHVARVDDTRMSFQSGGLDFSATSKQNLAPGRNVGTKSASALLERTRGLTVENTTQTHVANASQGPESISRFLQTGIMSNSEKAAIAAAVQAARTWSSDLEVQSVNENFSALVIQDAKRLQQTVTFDTDQRYPQMRVVKMASKRTAKPGDVIEFMIRFDNRGDQVIGNVTIIDNLTSRLEYIEGSASCDVKADLIAKTNDAQSVELRWEVIDPLEVGQGGVIKFRCKVR